MSNLKPNSPPLTPLDYGSMEGGLVRMMNRFWAEGTLTGDLAVDTYVRTYPNAALLGLLYDQRMLAEQAFMGPGRLMKRLGHLNMKRIADHDPDEFRTLFAEKPAVHRFTNKMAEYTQSVARVIVDEYGGNAENIWNDDASAQEIAKRLVKLPGFGKMKAYKMRFVLHYFGWRDFTGLKA